MKFGVLVFPGSNTDSYNAIQDTIAQPADQVWHTETDLSQYDCIVIPGGSSYGDYVRPGARIALGEMSLRCLTDPATLVSVATTLSSYHPVWFGDPTHGPLLELARENVPTLPIAAPVFIAQGESDDLVLPDLQRSYVEARCADGWALDYRTYAGRDHMGVVADESPLIDELMTWTADRFASVAVPDACTLATSSTP